MTTEINTFSAAVDDVMRRSGHPDRRADIIAYIRQTFRECQCLDIAGSPIYWQRDLQEQTLTVDAVPFIYETPQEWRALGTVRYNIVDRRNHYIYPKEINPGKAQNGEEFYYYKSMNSFVFSGIAANATLSMSYFKFFKKLPYYELAARPAVFTLEDDAWSYGAQYDTVELQTAARALVTNWILFDWYDLITEGALAKIYKTVQDPRAATSYALYKSYQKTLNSGEAKVSLGR